MDDFEVRHTSYLFQSIVDRVRANSALEEILL